MKNNILPPNKILDCLNCGSKINSSNKFCQTCGQKIKSYRLSIWLLLKEVFASILNFETKFFQTISNVWRPAFLTEAYVRGERKRFVNPGRFFIVTFFILSAAFSYMLKVNTESSDVFGDSRDLYGYSFRQDMVPLFDSLNILYPLSPSENVDSLRHNLFFSEAQLAKDSISGIPAFVSDTTGTYFTTQENTAKIATEDIHNLSKEELYEKYDVEGFASRLVFIQIVKFNKDPRAWTLFIVTNSLWTIVLSTFILAFFMKLLYVRRAYYFVEHLVFLMNFQSLIFLISVIGILLSLWIDDLPSSIRLLSMFLLSLWLVKNLRDYYRQSWFKTIIKSMIIFIVMNLIIIGCFLLVGVGSVMLY